MKKGFTLIELLAVVAILAILASVGALSYTAIQKRNTNRAEEVLKKQIENAAIEYAMDFGDKDQTVNYCDLVYNGYLEEDLKSPTEKKTIGSATTIVVNKNDKGNYTASLKYDFGDTNSPCEASSSKSSRKYIVNLIDGTNQIGQITVTCGNYYPSLPKLTDKDEDNQFKGWSVNESGTPLVYKLSKVSCSPDENGNNRPDYTTLYSSYGDVDYVVILHFPQKLGIPSKRLNIEKNQSIANILDEDMLTVMNTLQWYDNSRYSGEPFDLSTPITKEKTELWGRLDADDLYKVEFYGNKLTNGDLSTSTLLDTIESINPIDLSNSPSRCENGICSESQTSSVIIRAWGKTNQNSSNLSECYFRDDKINIDSDIKLFVVASAIKIYLNANGGNVDTTQLEIPGYGSEECQNLKQASNLPTPTREGYEFLGWYSAASGGTKVTGNLHSYNNQTLYAHWKEYDCFIDLYMPSAIGPQKRIKVANGGRYTFKAPDDLLSNSDATSIKGTVRGTYKLYIPIYSSDSEEVKIQKSSAMYSIRGNIGSTITCNKNLYDSGSGSMHFDAYITYRVGLMDISDNGYAETDVIYIKNTQPGYSAGKYIYPDLPTPTKSGYKFLGWYTSPTGGTKVNSGDDYTYTDQTSDAGNYRHSLLYARWEYRYKVSFNANGQSNLSFNEKEVTLNSVYGSLPTFTISTGETANLWSKSSSCSNSDDMVYASTVVTNTSPHTLYACACAGELKTVTYRFYYDKVATGASFTQTVCSGNVAQQPSDSIITSYANNVILDDYYTNTSFTTKYDFDTTISDNTTIYVNFVSKSSFYDSGWFYAKNVNNSKNIRFWGNLSSDYKFCQAVAHYGKNTYTSDGFSVHTTGSYYYVDIDINYFWYSLNGTSQYVEYSKIEDTYTFDLYCKKSTTDNYSKVATIVGENEPRTWTLDSTCDSDLKFTETGTRSITLNSLEESSKISYFNSHMVFRPQLSGSREPKTIRVDTVLNQTWYQYDVNNPSVHTAFGLTLYLDNTRKNNTVSCYY